MQYRNTKQNATFNSIKNLTADLRFSSFVEIIGAKAGDKVDVGFAGIEDCSENNKLIKSFCMPKSDIVLFRGLKCFFLLKVCMRVLRQTTISTGTTEMLKQ